MSRLPVAAVVEARRQRVEVVRLDVVLVGNDSEEEGLGVVLEEAPIVGLLEVDLLGDLAVLVFEGVLDEKVELELVVATDFSYLGVGEQVHVVGVLQLEGPLEEIVDLDVLNGEALGFSEVGLGCVVGELDLVHGEEDDGVGEDFENFGELFLAFDLVAGLEELSESNLVFADNVQGESHHKKHHEGRQL